jgi:hypothetical protein
MDFDGLLSDNLSPSIHQINHSSDSMFSIGNHFTPISHLSTSRSRDDKSHPIGNISRMIRHAFEMTDG